MRGHGEGTIYRRESDGRWVAAVSLDDGTRRCRYTKTRKLAVDALKDLQSGKALGVIGGPRLTLADFLQRWLADVEPRVRPSTFRGYRRMVLKRIIPALGHHRLTLLSVADVDAYLAVMAGKHGHTPAHHRAVLRAALNDGMRWSLVGRNVAALARLPKTTAFREPKALTLEQARTLMTGTKGERLHALWVLALYTGMRESELLGLARDDVDGDDRRIHLTLQLQRVPGNRSERIPGQWVRTPPKSAKGVRDIALAPDVLDALAAHERRMAAERQPDWPFFGLLFVTPEGTPLYGWDVLEQLYAAEKRLELPHVPLHDLRHTSASLMLAAGLSLEDVKQTLGHSSIRLTSDTYSHPQEERQREVAERMQTAIGGAR